MRAIRVASAALLGLGALALSAPAALAKGDGHDITPFAFTVLPSTVAAGGHVTLHVNRDGDCRGPATVRSAVFDTVVIRPGQSWGAATVDRDARPGAVYRVTFTCDGASGSTDLTVAGGHPRHPTPVPVNPTPVPVTPQRGVQAGEGGSIAGFDLKEIGMGAALIAASVGAAYHFSRRRGEDEA
ncbi:hypothetical protein LXH13_34525 [Streptomyces spinosirectus]|jgi:hypothetical protein|uniref:hypothetical protein n=1 Tax=Streptomyces TaxID=1883 RepID=UPI000D367438|nr:MULTISPECIES: hypothetical protein [Streptomyces]MBY8339065.1 hypothetical protein [Streptomyces plumbidurans]PTM93862.1 hypothetical protein C7821_107236 [Streptomyces sp. VMFN-G11Ma]UIR21845.1 hypothetical protein LXH13_34525 [Streptomyces spinosirectus]